MLIKKIIFQKCSLKNLYFLFLIAISLINFFFEGKAYEGKIEEAILNFDFENSYFLPSQLLTLYKQCLSDFLAIAAYFIRKKLIRKKEQWIDSLRPEGETNKDDSSLIYNVTEISKSQIKNKKIILYCIFISVLDFLQKFSRILYNIFYPDYSFMIYTFSFTVPLYITLQFIFSNFILKVHFYKHQYLSLFVNIGVLIIILSIDIFNAVKREDDLLLDGNTYYFMAFHLIFLVLELSFIKKILVEETLSIYLLIFIKGIIVSIFAIISSVIIHYKFKKKDDGDIFSRMKFLLQGAKYIVFAIGNIIFNFLESLFTLILIDKFSPNYYPFILIVQEFGTAILFKIREIIEFRENWELAVRIILYLILPLCVFLHNEIIVLNVCNLASDTKYFFNLNMINPELYEDDIDIIKNDETIGELGTEIGD